jgi:predicted DNA-binding mobile mystery protein A
MTDAVRRRVRRDLDEDLRVFRGRKVRRSHWGWLRGVRQALGMRVGEVARRMKVGHSEVYRLEMAEVRDSITLKKLRAMAEALGCEVVYAVVPAKGSLEDLAQTLEQERRKGRKGRRKSLAGRDPYEFVKTLGTVLALTEWHTGRGGEVR